MEENNSNQPTTPVENQVNIEPGNSFTYEDLGLGQNTAAFLAYFFGWLGIGGLIFYFISGNNKFVKFSAIQSMLYNAFVVGFYIAITLILGLFTFLTRSLGSLISIVLLSGATILVLVGWIFLMIRAYNGSSLELPIISNIAKKQIK